MDPNRPVVLAVIIGAHGVGGEVRLKVFAEDLNSYRLFNDGALTMTSLRHGSNGAIARFTEINDRNAAEAMRGTELAVLRSELPVLGKEEYYHFDLIGLPVVSTEGVALGSVVAVENFGAGDVIEIEKPDGKRFMVPMNAVDEWDQQVVLDAGLVE